MFIINAMMAVSNWLWGWPLLILTVVVAVVLTIKYKGFQFRFFGHSLKNTLGKIFEKSEGGEGNVTPSRPAAPLWLLRWAWATSPACPWLSLPAAPAPSSGCGLWL